MNPKNGLHAVGYNYAESEPIWVKFGTLWAKCLGLALADLGRDPSSSDDLRASRNFAVFPVRQITHGFSNFPSDKFYDISIQQRQPVSPCKLSEQNFKNFTIRGRFSEKTRKLFKNFSGLATSGRHNSAMITKAENSRLNDPPTWCLVYIFTVRINSRSNPWAVPYVQAVHPPDVFASSITYCIDNAVTWHHVSSNAVSKTASLYIAVSSLLWISDFA